MKEGRREGGREEGGRKEGGRERKGGGKGDGPLLLSQLYSLSGTK